ncbi:MAG TPA: hypothetical protein VFG59_09305 [Anaeromyxobacter sp.]|nr:hypothetical protein [Anaeromyxobacter sp.]
MPRSSILLLAALLGACSGARLPKTPRGEAILQVRGAVKHAPFRLGEQDLAALRQGKLRGVDPETGREASYEGVDLSALEDRLDLTGGADTLVLRTADRRAVPIPLSLLQELRPVLAGRRDGTPLSELMVAWPNVEHHGFSTDPRASLWWAHKVIALEYVAWARSYGRALHVVEGAPPGALAGGAVFGMRCSACHRVHEVGGANGPDLGRVGESLTPERLREILRGHPGWDVPGAEPPLDATAGQLLAFLRTMARTPAPDPNEPGDKLERRARQ